MAEARPLPRLGKYELRGELGRGAMGVVYRAYDPVMCREVALKTMTAPDDDEAQTVRFLREARTAGALHHPNIVTIHELGQYEGTYFISMELLEGRNLRELIGSEQLPPIHMRLEIIARACDGLDYAHRAGIVHRDVKPANVFLLTGGTVKILDFGIAKIDASEATRTGMLIGTVDYMSPEQVRAVKDLDGRSDIFSTGTILYELLFRRKPFAAEHMGATLHRILHQQPPGYTLFDRVLPVGLADVLRRCLDKRPEARFSRAGEMAEALDRVAATLRGRAGTEVEERIDEILASGALESKDTEPLVVGDGTGDDPTSLADDYVVPESDGTGVSAPRRPRIAVAAAVAIGLAVLLAGGAWLSSRGDRSPDPVPNPPGGAAPTAGAVAGLPDGAAGPAGAAGPVEAELPAPVPAPPPGQLELVAMPWANVEWIENLDTGERVPSEASTPVRLDLPEGRYRLRLVNPYAARPLEVEAEVRAHENTVLRRMLPGFDAAELAGEILAAEVSTRGSR